MRRILLALAVAALMAVMAASSAAAQGPPDQAQGPPVHGPKWGRIYVPQDSTHGLRHTSHLAR
jgi:Spy/CpxP family protein refolding chaperone